MSVNAQERLNRTGYNRKSKSGTSYLAQIIFVNKLIYYTIQFVHGKYRFLYRDIIFTALTVEVKSFPPLTFFYFYLFDPMMLSHLTKYNDNRISVFSFSLHRKQSVNILLHLLQQTNSSLVNQKAIIS